MLTMSHAVLRVAPPHLTPDEHEGAEERFNQLYLRYAEPMRLYLRTHFGHQVSPETLEEMHQDLFFKLWSMISNLDERTVSGLLFRMARNAGIDQTRSIALGRRYVLDAPATEDQDEDPGYAVAGGVDPEARAMDRETLAEVIQAARTPKKLTIILLVALGFSFTDIAAITGLSMPAVKTMLWRFRHEDYPAFAQAQAVPIQPACEPGRE